MLGNIGLYPFPDLFELVAMSFQALGDLFAIDRSFPIVDGKADYSFQTNFFIFIL